MPPIQLTTPGGKFITGIRPYYEIPNQRIIFHSVKSPLRQGSYRALATTANH